ncbi:hypothetical protein V5F29_05190 [Xanthobacter aminoxidans]|uniref:hypothetical protein n=1 Tax=Xanthobacter aminoxidans TaxID=186280 RepID=UPI003728086C
MPRPQPWKPADATDEIRQLANAGDKLTISRTRHFIEQLELRDLLMGDALYVMKHGFVYQEAQASTQDGLFKYRIDSKSPNSGSRALRVVLIPDHARCWIKLITIMWVDEA